MKHLSPPPPRKTKSNQDLADASLFHGDRLTAQQRRVMAPASQTGVLLQDVIQEENKRLNLALKKLRKTKGIKQDVLARALGMTQSNYSKIEKGIRQLSMVQVKLILATLNADMIELQHLLL